MKPKAWILNIGNELTIGRIVNTNGAWLARQLTLRGVDVRRIIVVPDDENEVCDIVKQGVSKGIALLVTAGGLGPTPDDRTVEFVAKALGKKVVLNEEALRMVESKYKLHGLELTPERVKMAYLPEGAKPIPNDVGTAPGVFMSVANTRIILLPGVPREAEVMFERYVIPLIKDVLPRLCVVEDGITVEGLPESSIAPLLKTIMKKYPNVYIKSHPKGSELVNPIVEIKVLASASNCDDASKLVRKVLEDVKQCLEWRQES